MPDRRQRICPLILRVPARQTPAHQAVGRASDQYKSPAITLPVLRCHPERSSSRSLRAAQSKDPRICLLRCKQKTVILSEAARVLCEPRSRRTCGCLFSLVILSAAKDPCICLSFRSAAEPGAPFIAVFSRCRGPRRALFARRGGMSGVFVVPEGAWRFSPGRTLEPRTLNLEPLQTPVKTLDSQKSS